MQRTKNVAVGYSLSNIFKREAYINGYISLF
jgi:hypothetical protein